MAISIARRTLIAAGAAFPLALDTSLVSAAQTPPPYTLSINIEIMFPRETDPARGRPGF
jgi:hypothetical protein